MDMGDVGRRSTPLGDRLGPRGRGELRHDGGRDSLARVEGWQRAVEEVRVAAEQLFVVVEIAFVDFSFSACQTN